MKVVFRSAINKGSSLIRSHNELKHTIEQLAQARYKEVCNFSIRDLKGKYQWSARSKCFLMTLTPHENWNMPVREHCTKTILYDIAERFRSQESQPERILKFDFNGYKVTVTSFCNANVLGFEVNIRM